MKIVHETKEYAEAVKEEVGPLLKILSVLLKNRGILTAMVTTRSEIGDFLFNDKDGTQLSQLSRRLGIDVNYTDKLFAVARRMQP